MNPIITILCGVIAFLALIVFLVTFIYFLIDNFSNKNRSTMEKLLWLIAVLLIGFLPVFIYFFVNKKIKWGIISLVSFLLIPGTLILYVILNFVSIHQNNKALYFDNNLNAKEKPIFTVNDVNVVVLPDKIDKNDFDPNQKSWHNYEILHTCGSLGVGLGSPDYDKYIGTLCITSFDSDGDGLDNDLELRYGTDPNYPDSDGNGIIDSKEIDWGFNPIGVGLLEVEMEPLPLEWSIYNHEDFSFRYPSYLTIDDSEAMTWAEVRIYDKEEMIEEQELQKDSMAPKFKYVDIYIKSNTKRKDKSLLDWINDEFFNVNNIYDQELLLKWGGARYTEKSDSFPEFIEPEKVIVGNSEGYKSRAVVDRVIWYFVEMFDKETVYFIEIRNTNLADPLEDIYNEFINSFEFKK